MITFNHNLLQGYRKTKSFGKQKVSENKKFRKTKGFGKQKKNTQTCPHNCRLAIEQVPNVSRELLPRDPSRDEDSSRPFAGAVKQDVSHLKVELLSAKLESKISGGDISATDFWKMDGQCRRRRRSPRYVLDVLIVIGGRRIGPVFIHYQSIYRQWLGRSQPPSQIFLRLHARRRDGDNAHCLWRIWRRGFFGTQTRRCRVSLKKITWIHSHDRESCIG